MTLARTAAMMLVLASAVPAHARAGLPAAEAAAFIGAWTLGLDTPEGPMEMSLDLTDESGNVAASVTVPDGPIAGTTIIKDISRDADKLVLRYMINYQGMDIDAEIALVPVGEQCKAAFSFAGGQFMVDGTASKK